MKNIQDRARVMDNFYNNPNVYNCSTKRFQQAHQRLENRLWGNPTTEQVDCGYGVFETVITA